MKILCRKFCKEELEKVEARFNAVGANPFEGDTEVEEDEEEEYEEE
jgi:hypothetical protein